MTPLSELPAHCTTTILLQNQGGEVWISELTQKVESSRARREGRALKKVTNFEAKWKTFNREPSKNQYNNINQIVAYEFIKNIANRFAFNFRSCKTWQYSCNACWLPSTVTSQAMSCPGLECLPVISLFRWTTSQFINEYS